MIGLKTARGMQVSAKVASGLEDLGFYVVYPWLTLHSEARILIFVRNSFLIQLFCFWPKRAIFSPKRGFSPLTFEPKCLWVCHFAPRWHLSRCSFLQNLVTGRSLHHELWRNKYFRISLPPLFERDLCHEGEYLLQIWRWLTESQRTELVYI